MLLNDLASLARGAGLTVTEAPNWIGHNHGQLSSVECIVIHHTAGPATGDYPSYNTVRNGRPGLEGPLAQLGVGRSGKVYVFSNGVSWHAGTVKSSWMDNYHAIGIEVESVGTGPEWPSAQVHAAAKLTAALCKRYGVPVSRVLGHKEVCYPVGRKVDPIGIPGDMPAFRALVQQYISGTAQKDDDDMALNDKLPPVKLSDGKTYTLTVADVLQGMAQYIAGQGGARAPLTNHPAGQYVGRVVSIASLNSQVAALKGQVDALLNVVQQLSKGEAVDVEAVRQAAESGTAKALRENTVNVDIDISGTPSA